MRNNLVTSRRAAMEWAAERLEEAGVDDPRRDAEVLLCHAAGLSRAQVLAFRDEPVPEAGLEAFRAAVARRATLEPVAYIIGEREFWSLPFKVTPAVLIPRPETETLVAACLERLPAPPRAPRILDVGTGSGAILGAQGSERPDATLLGVDLSPEALAVARENLDALAATRGSGRAELRCGDLFGPIADDERFDLIVSNPPYIGTEEADDLMADVRDHEPDLALYGGAGGLAIIERLVAEAPRHLAPGGWLAFEMAVRQRDAVDALLAASGCDEHAIGRDLSGDPRWAVARWGGFAAG
jgi:release factor glutamine methyltransferase